MGWVVLDATIDWLKNYASIAIRQNDGDLENMKSSFLASLFHASNKDNMYHYPHCPTSSDTTLTEPKTPKLILFIK